MKSSGGGGSQNVTQRAVSEPWKASQPYLESVMDQAQKLYQKGVGPNYYPGATYVGPTRNETQGMNQMQRLAQQGNPFMGNIQQQMNAMLQGGGMSGAQRNNLQNFNSVANGSQQINTGGQYQQIANRFGGPTAAQRYGQGIANGSLGINTGGMWRNAIGDTQDPTMSQRFLSQTAAGKNIGRDNELLMKVLGTTAQEQADQTSSLFSAGGRYGGGAHQGTVARETGETFNRGLLGQMNADLDRQMAAAGQIDQLSQNAMGQRMQGIGQLGQVQGQNIGNRMNAANAIDAARQGYGNMQLGALGGKTNVQGANIANRIGAASQLQGAYQGANSQLQGFMGMAPAMNDMRYGDAQRLINVGAAQRGELQGQLQDNIARFNAKNSRPWEQLSLYNNMISGMGGMGGTQSQYAPQGSPIAGLLGGAATGASMGSMFGPWGTAIGGGAGGLLGMFM